MRTILLAALLLAAWPALANQCLPEANQAAAIARSVQEGVAMGVPDGSPWWAQQLSGAEWCVVVETAPRAAPGYDFTANPLPVAINGVAPNAIGVATGLSPAEIATLTAIGAQAVP